MRHTPQRLSVSLFALYLIVCVIWSVSAESPAPLEEVAPLEDIDHEARLRIAKIGELLATQEAFDESREGELRQNFGTLACLGQALAEHPGGDATVVGARLRDGALMYTRDSDYEQAQAALAACIAAAEGAATDEFAEIDHEWNRLIGMHAMMEEINARNAQIARSLRRPRGDADSISNASTIAILALAMEADTHEVKDEADLPLWQELSTEYRQEMTALAEALRANDAAAVREHFTNANTACDRCHEQFRDVE